MEIHHLSTAVLKQHQLSVRRVRLSLRKRWVSHVNTQMLKGQMALPTPTVGIYMNYMMDKGTKSWSVLGQLKGGLSTDHVPHPLTYSGYTIVVKPSWQELPIGASLYPEDFPEDYRAHLRYDNRKCLPISSVNVKFSHKILDESRGRCNDQDFDSLCCQRNQDCKHDTAKGMDFPKIYDCDYQISCYLKLQYEVTVGHTTMRLVHLDSGLFPVSSFSPKDVLCALVSLWRPTISKFLADPFPFPVPETDIDGLSLLAEVISYFGSQETFECDSILKLMRDTPHEPEPSLVPSLRILLGLKRDHLTTLGAMLLQPLETLLESFDHINHEKLRRMKESVEFTHRLTSALEDPNTDVDTLRKLAETRITEYYAPYRSWWKSLWSELPGEVCSELYRQLSTGYPECYRDMTFPDLSFPTDHWFGWTRPIRLMSQWVEYMRGFHEENHSANHEEQDQVYLGSTGRCDLSRRFVPTYRACHTGGHSACSSYFHKNHLIEQDSYYKIRGPSGFYQGLEPYEHSSSQRLLKGNYIYSVSASHDRLEWKVLPLRSLTLQTVLKYQRQNNRMLQLNWLCYYSLSDLIGADSGPNYMVVLLSFQTGVIGLLSIRLEASQANHFTSMDQILPQAELSQLQQCQSHHHKEVQDPTRVFPLAFFEHKQLVLFAQLSLDTLASDQIDVGVRFYAFSHNATDQSFAFLRSDRIKSHTAHTEEFVSPPNLVGWDSRRSVASRFWFRWRELQSVKLGVWIGDCGGYSLFMWTKGRFVGLGRRRIPAVQWDSSTTLAECRLGPEQPTIGVSRVIDMVGGRLGLECWLFRLRL